jgi:hypothetical protein
VGAILDLQQAISRFGVEAKAKLANLGATGEPEDQLRAPLERYSSISRSILDEVKWHAISVEFSSTVGTINANKYVKSPGLVAQFCGLPRRRGKLDYARKWRILS